MFLLSFINCVSSVILLTISILFKKKHRYYPIQNIWVSDEISLLQIGNWFALPVLRRKHLILLYPRVRVTYQSEYGQGVGVIVADSVG